LIASDDGPGVLSRIFFADIGFSAERIRIYVDDMATPAYDASIAEWANIDRALAPPWTGATSGGLVSRAPIVYQRSLRVLLDDLRSDALYYYHVGIQRGGVSQTVPLESSGAELVRLFDQVRHASDAPVVQLRDALVEAGETLALLDETGSGTVKQLNISFRDGSITVLRDLALRIIWENAEAPALDLPLATLFGCRDQAISFDTLPLALEVRGSSVELEASWPMPFFEHARIDIVNRGRESRQVSARVAWSRDAVAPESMHFHAQTHENVAPFADAARYTVAAMRGPGKYVGTLVQMDGEVDPGSATPLPLGFLEGDERIVVDGATVGEGTGTEDYFDAGWYFPSGPFSTPFASAIAIASDDVSQRGSVTAARWHLMQDAIEFADSFELTFEYGANRPASATRYASVAFFYAAAP
jgi:hypothetical protein